jgi:TolB-like protein/DNA-binding winged helix-turn-helix (wHTH) protein/Flp pilus assembly protein TadD
MPAGTTPRGFRFGVFEVDLAAADLRRDGRQIRLRGRPFDILMCLLERPGELVTRDELRQRLWTADTFVDFDHGLNAAMNRLRDALGDSADNPRFVQTLPRRGYRFIAPVERVEAPSPALESSAPPVMGEIAVPVETAAPAVRSRSSFLTVATVIAALVAVVAAGLWLRASQQDAQQAGRPMIAVLPFENLSGDPEEDYFSQGITEELIAQLGTLNPDSLGVIARTTVARYRPGQYSIAEIGRALDVQYVLEGSVRRSGQRVRITAQLIEVARQTHLWAEAYEHEVEDVLLTQRDVAMRVADALAMSVLRTRTVPRMPSPAAYEAYLRGRYLRQQATEQSLARARTYYEQAIESDPTYGAAYAGLADVYHVLGGPGWEFGPPRELLPRALEAARRAIELDAELPDGYAVRAMCRLWFEWNPAAAEQDLRRAISLNPSFTQGHQYLSTVLTVQGRADEAIAAARKAAQLDPLSPVSGTTLAYRFYYAGKYDEALKEFGRTIEIAPEFASARLGEAQAYRELGRPAESLAALQRAAPFSGGRTYLQAHLAYAQAVNGHKDEARKILDGLHDLAATRYVSPYDLGLIAAGLGDRTAVRAHLERAFAERSGWMMFVGIEREFAPYLEDLAGLLKQVRPATD